MAGEGDINEELQSSKAELPIFPLDLLQATGQIITWLGLHVDLRFSGLGLSLAHSCLQYFCPYFLTEVELQTVCVLVRNANCLFLRVSSLGI